MNRLRSLDHLTQGALRLRIFRAPSQRPMHPDELAFLEEMLANAELLDCAGCGEQTLHTHEQVVSVAGGVTELLMRCTHCMACRPWFQMD